MCPYKLYEPGGRQSLVGDLVNGQGRQDGQAYLELGVNILYPHSRGGWGCVRPLATLATLATHKKHTHTCKDVQCSLDEDGGSDEDEFQTI